MGRTMSEGSALTAKNTKGTKLNNSSVSVGIVIAIDFLCALSDLCGFLGPPCNVSRIPRSKFPLCQTLSISTVPNRP